MSTESGERPRVRASDAEREEYAAVVREATGDGRLSVEEGEQRQAAVYTAAYRDELPPLVADLPGPAFPGGPNRFGGGGFGHGGFGHGGRGPGGFGGRRWAGSGAGAEGGGPDPETLRRWARLAFGRHLIFTLAVAAVLITIWALTGAHFFWPVIPLALLTIGLVKHGLWMRFAGVPGAPWARHGHGGRW